jgi:tRNA (guanine37-N1)-methyltransferase
MKTFHIITLFQEACEPYVQSSILGRAQKNKKMKVVYQNPRNFVDNKWGKVDEKPYGGGPGMVVQALPVAKAVAKACARTKKKPAIIWFSPSAKQFTNKDADALLKYDNIVLVCGRYEGIDERAKKIMKTLGTVKEFAVGEAVYTGGELPALSIIDAVTRRIKGVLGNDISVEERRIAGSAVYTRPEIIEYKKKNYKVPKVLTTGHHKNIDEWRAKK